MKSLALRIATVILGVSVYAVAQSTAPATATAPSVDPNKVVLKVGQTTITAQQFNDFISDLPEQYQMMAQGPGKRMLAEELVKFKLLANEATRRGLDQSPKFKRQLDIIRDQILASLLASDLQNAADEAELRKYYDEHKGEFESVEARHILIRVPDSPVPATPGKQELTDEQAQAKANEIRARLEKGEKFEELAKAESDDKGSGARGGELGTFQRGQMVKPFEDAAFALKAGEISQPVRTPFGWHIIQVQQHEARTFEEARPEIEQRLAPQKMEQLIQSLRESTPVELDESFFGPAHPALPQGHPMMP